MPQNTIVNINPQQQCTGQVPCSQLDTLQGGAGVIQVDCGNGQVIGAAAPAPSPIGGAPCAVGGAQTEPDPCINVIWQSVRCEAGQTIFSALVENQHTSLSQNKRFKLLVNESSSPNATVDSAPMPIGPGQTRLVQVEFNYSGHSKTGDLYRLRVKQLDANANPISVTQSERQVQLDCPQPTTTASVPDINLPPAAPTNSAAPSLPVAPNLNCTDMYLSLIHI